MTKILSFALIALSILLISSLFVSAAGELSVSSVTIGGSSEERSNPEADSESEHVRNKTVDVSFTNNGNFTITALTFETVGSGSKYTPSLTDKPTELLAGATGVVKLTIKIPEDQDSFDSDRSTNDRAFDIGDLKVTGTYNGASVSATGDVKLEVENKVVLTKVKIEINGDSETVSSGETIKVKPGDKLLLTVKAKNEFSNSDNLNINDPEIFIDLQNDGDFDYDDTITFSDLDPKDEVEEEVSLDLEKDASDETHNVVLLLTGKDDNGAIHGERFEFEIRVKRDTHDLKIEDLEITPQALSCSSKNLNVNVNVLNIGTGDEDSVSLKVESSRLDFLEYRHDLNLDEDDDFTQSFSIPIPSGLSAGDYPLTATTYYDRTKLSDSESLLVSVPNCTPVVVIPTQPTTTVQTGTTTVQTTTQPTTQATTTTTTLTDSTVETVEADSGIFGESSIYIWILGVIILILLVAVIVLSVKFVFSGD